MRGGGARVPVAPVSFPASICFDPLVLFNRLSIPVIRLFELSLSPVSQDELAAAATEPTTLLHVRLHAVLHILRRSTPPQLPSPPPSPLHGSPAMRLVVVRTRECSW